MSKKERKRTRKPAKERARKELRKRTLAKRFAPRYVEQARTTQARSAVKTVCYRALSATETGILAWLVVPVYGAGTFAALDAIGNTVLYYAFERVWAHIDLWTRKKNGA